MTILIMGDGGVGPERSVDVSVDSSTGTSGAGPSDPAPSDGAPADGTTPGTTTSGTTTSGTATPGAVTGTAAAPDTRGTWDRAAQAFRDWRAGTPGAMDRLVVTMTPVLWHVVRASRLDEAMAQDVVQTTWVAFVQHAGSIADPQAVGAWLTTTARREAWRVSRRARSDVPVDDEVLEWVVDERGSPEEVAVVHDEEDRLWACVQRLSERCRRLLRIVAFEERPSYAQVATDLGMAVGSVGPTRMRCLTKLREELTAAGGVP